MIFFVKSIILDSVPVKVHFTEIKTGKGVKFFVFTSDVNGNTSSFRMEQDRGEWRIANPPRVTTLFLKNESRLSQTINETLKIWN